MPCGMEEYFAAGDRLDLMEAGLDDLPYGLGVVLAARVPALPMGFTWALRLCQDVAAICLLRSGAGPTSVIVDGQVGIELGPCRP
eukprot:818087-Pyramimonas_sp.AAC.1